MAKFKRSKLSHALEYDFNSEMNDIYTIVL
jgi:hypothetical protein